jgi:hypothetical protein
MHLHFSKISTVIVIAISVHGMCKFVRDIRCPLVYCFAESTSSSVCASIGFIKIPLKEEKFINKYSYHKEGGCFNFVILVTNILLVFDYNVLIELLFKKYIF